MREDVEHDTNAIARNANETSFFMGEIVEMYLPISA